MSYFIHQRRETSRRGFTLIELLIVIVIIGILASLILVGAGAARKRVRQTLIKYEISQVSMAIESYQKVYGEYPPDFSDEAAVMRHVRKRWPNFNWFNQSQNFAGFCRLVEIGTGYDFTTASEHGVTKSRAAHIGALAFWLGGVHDEGTGLLHGFSADVTSPFGLSPSTGNADPVKDSITQWDAKSQFMELTVGVNCDIVDDLPVITANNLPIVYFKPNAAGKYLQKGTSNPEPLCFHFHYDADKYPTSWQDLGIGVPYAKTDHADLEKAVWHNPKSYQLIHPGYDGKFSDDSPAEFRVLDPAKDITKGCTLADNDNQANFGGTTIEAAGN